MRFTAPVLAVSLLAASPGLRGHLAFAQTIAARAAAPTAAAPAAIPAAAAAPLSTRGLHHALAGPLGPSLPAISAPSLFRVEPSRLAPAASAARTALPAAAARPLRAAVEGKDKPHVPPLSPSIAGTPATEPAGPNTVETPGAPKSAKNETLALLKRYERALRGESAAPSAEMLGHRFLLIPGLVRRKGEAEMRPNLERLITMGLDAEIVKTGGLATLEENAAIIKTAIEASDKPVVLLAHSKGGLDALEALKQDPDLQEKVSRVVTLQTPYFGTQIADWWLEHPLLLKANILVHMAGKRAKNVARTLRQLSRKTRANLPDTRPALREGLQVFSIASRVDGGFKNLVPSFLSQEFFLRRLSKSSNDGRVNPEHAVVPGSVFAWLEGVSHAATVKTAGALERRLRSVRGEDADFAANLTEAVVGWIFDKRFEPAAPPKKAAPAPEAPPAKIRGIGGLLAAQALAIFNDSGLKTLFIIWVTATMPLAEAATLMSLGTGLYVLPFLLFSLSGGKLADRVGKAPLIILLKAAEIALTLIAATALTFGSVYGMMALLFLMGTHSALIGPAKYSLLAEKVDPRVLGKANGLLEMTANFALMFGTAAGGLLYAAFAANLPAASVVFISVAAAGFLASLTMRRKATDRALPDEDQRPLPLRKLPRALFMTALTLSLFWFIASMIQLNIFLFGEHVLRASEGLVTAMVTAVGVSMGLGSFLAGVITPKGAERGIVPFGVLGVVLSLADLALFGSGSVVRAFVDLALLGLSAGIFFVPLNTHLQRESPAASRGRIIGLSIFLGHASIMLSAGIFYLLNNLWLIGPANVFLVTAALAALAGLGIAWRLKDQVAALFRTIIKGK